MKNWIIVIVDVFPVVWYGGMLTWKHNFTSFFILSLGEMIGEAGLLDDGPPFRFFSVLSCGSSELLELSKEHFDAHIRYLKYYCCLWSCISWRVCHNWSPVGTTVSEFNTQICHESKVSRCAIHRIVLFFPLREFFAIFKNGVGGSCLFHF